MRVTLKKGSYHRSYSLQRKGLSGLSFDLQSSESGYVKRERKGGLVMHASIPIALFSFFHLVSFIFFFSQCFLFSILSSLLLSCLPPLLFMVTNFYTVCHYRIYPFYPSTVFCFLWASLQDCPLTYQLSNHYICLKCVGCTTLHFQKKLFVLFLTSHSFCFTLINWIKLSHHLPLWHASSGPSPHLPLLDEMPFQQDILPKKLGQEPQNRPCFLPITKLHPQIP